MGKTDFYKYFVSTEKTIDTGLYIENVGNSYIKAGDEYPLPHHPHTHYFQWGKGRFLKEYQLLYINKGKGVFESANCGKTNLLKGSVFLLYPNEWHRYRPLPNVGWEEYWVGFNGCFANKFIDDGMFLKEMPVSHLSNSTVIQSLFLDIISYSRKERPGSQQIISGILLQILGQIQLLSHSNNFIGKPIEGKIDKAIEFMQQHMQTSINLRKIASQLNISYSLFRKRFKEYTGISPHQYYIQLKIKRAQTLLLNTALPIQNIAFETGFENVFHFSKAFKDRTGYAPSEFRRIETR